MELIKYIFSGLVSLIMDQVNAHKAEIESALLGFVKSLIDHLLSDGHDDTVAKIQKLVDEHSAS